MALTGAMETDPVVMAELGGAVPPDEVPTLHAKRLTGDPWLVIEADGEPAGTIGIWETEHEGEPIHETGWMLLRRMHGRGIASAALAQLIEIARADERFEALHAFPGVTNPASNALCRRFDFELRGEIEGSYRGIALRCNHWVLTL